jgi:hypothetical protein
MRKHSLIIALALSVVGSAAVAEFAKIEDQSQFVELVAGKTLKRPFVELQVSPEGQISGVGAAWEVSGNWTWQDGFFCRDLTWGGDSLGYNCQAVEVRDGRIRFTSDRGQGDSAEFSLR